jgi:hypothetical protein
MHTATNDSVGKSKVQDCRLPASKICAPTGCPAPAEPQWYNYAVPVRNPLRKLAGFDERLPGIVITLFEIELRTHSVDRVVVR